MKLNEETWSQQKQQELRQVFNSNGRSFDAFLLSVECSMIKNFLLQCVKEGEKECAMLAKIPPEYALSSENAQLKYRGGGLVTLEQLCATFSVDKRDEEEEADYADNVE